MLTFKKQESVLILFINYILQNVWKKKSQKEKKKWLRRSLSPAIGALSPASREPNYIKSSSLPHFAKTQRCCSMRLRILGLSLGGWEDVVTVLGGCSVWFDLFLSMSSLYHWLIWIALGYHAFVSRFEFCVAHFCFRLGCWFFNFFFRFFLWS